jgi:hypothetical protein
MPADSIVLLRILHRFQAQWLFTQLLTPGSVLLIRLVPQTGLPEITTLGTNNIHRAKIDGF